MHLRIFYRLTKLLDLHLLLLKFIIQCNDLVSEFWNLRNLISHYFELTLAFLQLEQDHTDPLFPLSNFLLSILENILLNIGFLIQDTELIITVDKLNSHIVS